MKHVPVLLNETIDLLNLQSGDSVIDATLGGGGHTRAIAERIAPDGKLLAIEWDEESLVAFKEQNGNAEWAKNIILTSDSYVNLSRIIDENSFSGVKAILFDLGMSSWHVDESGKGFSFLRDELLDMRYDTKLNQETAAWVANHYSAADLENIFKEYGEERFAGPIARAIVERRKQKKILTTLELVEIIKDAVPVWYQHGKRNVATKVFQAIRIEVNSEMENIEQGIRSAIENVIPGGRIAVISFHSKEDRIVKQLFKNAVRFGLIKLVHKKPITPSREETKKNPRARSASLRIVEKL